MNKAAIKKELRRSACEDTYPIWELDEHVFRETSQWREKGQFFATIDDCRTFFLLVAEAL